MRPCLRFVRCAAVLWVCAPGLAQSNALRNVVARQAPPATGASTRPTAPGLVPGPFIRQPLTPVTAVSEPPVNPVLQSTSLIAVDLPKPKKLAVHDLVTVIIREDKRFTSDAKLETEKEIKLDAALKQWFRLDPEDRLVPQNFERAGAPGAQFDLKHQYDGNGKFNRQDSLVTRIQTRVIDVKPNGNLVLEARKEIVVEGESQAVTLTGECRAMDVTAQNSVLSTQIADLRIRVDGGGATHDASRRGWLKKAWDLIRPL